MDRDLLYLLKVFCAVVDAGSLTTAAENIGVQAPAVSKALVRLEKSLGKRLLNRSTRTIELTDAGQYFYTEGLKQLISVETLLDGFNDYHHTLTGTLTITSTAAIGEGVICPQIATFSAIHPELKLDLLFTNEIVRLPSQNIDIAIRSSQSLEDSSLTSQKLFEMRRVVVASPAYLASNKAPLTPENINLHTCLNFKHRGLYDRWKYHDNNDQQLLQTNTLVSANSYAALKTLCLNNMGLVRLFEYQVADEIESGELVRLMGHLDWGKQSIHAVYHGKMSDSPKVKAFLHYFSAINS